MDDKSLDVIHEITGNHLAEYSEDQIKTYVRRNVNKLVPEAVRHLELALSEAKSSSEHKEAAKEVFRVLSELEGQGQKDQLDKVMEFSETMMHHLKDTVTGLGGMLGKSDMELEDVDFKVVSPVEEEGIEPPSSSTSNIDTSKYEQFTEED